MESEPQPHDSDSPAEVPAGPAYDPVHYLEAKRSIDERALNDAVWERFVDELIDRADSDGPVDVFEIGGGTGATVRRLATALRDRETELDISYTLVDVDDRVLKAAGELLAEWGREKGYDVFATPDRVVWTSDVHSFSIELLERDGMEALQEGRYDAVVAQAVLDLLHVPTAVERITGALRGGGLAYLPVNIDGVTTFRPATDPALDRTVERLYNDSMTRSTDRGESGGARSGRKLFDALREAGHAILEAGPSDWVVFDRDDGEYPEEEGYFLRVILGFVEKELRGHPDIDEDRLDAWLQTRRDQVRSGELTYMTHQIDILSRRPR